MEGNHGSDVQASFHPIHLPCMHNWYTINLSENDEPVVNFIIHCGSL